MGVALLFPLEKALALDWIRIGDDGSSFHCGADDAPFVIWGVNYDHTEDGKLLEEYWEENWPQVVEDFGEIKELGANVVRIHLQLERFITDESGTPNGSSLNQLKRLLKLAESSGLYLDITGLGCYRKAKVPAWYDAMTEGARWEIQARFWEAVAQVCKDSPAVFCYDLMNEPVLSAPKDGKREWLTGELGGYHFVQRITLDLAGRSQKQVAQAWADRLTKAIRKHDQRHLITVGVIPWVHVFPKAKPLFYSPEVSAHFDFVSVHFYPKKGEVDAALTALSAYAIGKPLIIEETFPLHCSGDELMAFIDGSRERASAQGWISFYWGKTADEYEEEGDLTSAIKAKWLRRFQEKGALVLGR